MRVVSRARKQQDARTLTVEHEASGGSSFSMTAVATKGEDENFREASFSLTFKARVPKANVSKRWQAHRVAPDAVAKVAA